MEPIELMTPAELASVVSVVSADALTTALATFTDQERRALVGGDMGAAAVAMECRLVCVVELDRRTGVHRAGSN